MALFRAPADVNAGHEMIKTDERRAMNGFQFQMRMELCYQLRDPSRSLNGLDLLLKDDQCWCLMHNT